MTFSLLSRSLSADHQFLRFRPSILAAVCLAVARRQARIEPLWPPRLERKTGYTLDEMAECFHFTWTYVMPRCHRLLSHAWSLP